MIQRIQSVYLFVTTVLSFLFLKGSFLNFIDKSGSVIKLTFIGIVREISATRYELLEKSFPLSLIIILVPVLSAVTIFFFRKRSLQLWLAKFLIFFVAGLIFVTGLYAYLIITNYHAEIVPGVKMIIPVLQLIFSVLAFRGIKKDDNLVKSYDRLR